MTYLSKRQLKKKADRIIDSLKARIDQSGYYENLGQDELREYRHLVQSADNLGYTEQWDIIDNLSIRIDNL